MSKFTVRCYYTYCAEVEVEADSIEEAKEIGYDICSEKTTDELDYVGYTDTEVMDETGEIHQLS